MLGPTELSIATSPRQAHGGPGHTIVDISLTCPPYTYVYTCGRKLSGAAEQGGQLPPQSSRRGGLAPPKWKAMPLAASCRSRE